MKKKERSFEGSDQKIKPQKRPILPQRWN